MMVPSSSTNSFNLLGGPASPADLVGRHKVIVAKSAAAREHASAEMTVGTERDLQDLLRFVSRLDQSERRLEAVWTCAQALWQQSAFLPCYKTTRR